MSESTSAPTPNPAGNSSADAVIGFVMMGTTNEGKKFRPSDWADRLQGALAAFCEDDDELEEAMECVQVVSHKGVKAVLVRKKLEEIDGRVYAFFRRFAADNDLEIDDFLEQHLTPR